MISACIRICSLLILIIPNYQIRAQGEFALRNIDYLYDLDAELIFDTQYFTTDSSIQLHSVLTINESRTRIDDIFLQYAFIDDYSDEMELSRDTLYVKNVWMGNSGKKHYLKFSIPIEQQHNSLIIRLFNQKTNSDFLYNIQIPNENQSFNPNIVIYSLNDNRPVLTPYYPQNKEFRLELAEESENVSGFAYFEDFNLARPPMAAPDDAAVSKNISIDSTFTIGTRDTLQLSREGLYLIQNDTTQLSGIPIRIVDRYFPKMVKLPELIGALTYITSSNEFSDISTSSDPKKAFDQFWITNTQSQDRARRAIMNYYRRVAHANQLFTTYKEGWKTDKGMVYIIFGKPDEVYRRNNTEEEWIYQRTSDLPAVSFTFFKINSILSGEHYVLLRKKSYQSVWFQMVDYWRKGRIEY